MQIYRTILIIFFITINTTNVFAQQQPIKNFQRASFTANDSLSLANEYGKHKKLPAQFSLQALIALSYFPELKNTHIKIIMRHAHSPLKTKPTFPGVLLGKHNRRFRIIVSDSSEIKVEPLLLEDMGFNAQVGVLGHEFSHCSDFKRRSIFYLAGVGIGHLSFRYMNRFEYKTDSICIGHGLAFQLLAWSNYVRAKTHKKNYEGADNINAPVLRYERYMNPSTITKRIEADPQYAAAK